MAFFAPRGLRFAAALLTVLSAAAAAQASAPRHDPAARALLDQAKAKIMAVNSLVVEFEGGRSPTKNFDGGTRIYLERPSRFRIELITGNAVEKRIPVAVSDGQTVTTYDSGFMAYDKPVRRENFFLGYYFMLPLFFEPKEIRFDPSGATWGRPVSLFDGDASAYDSQTQLTSMGTRTLEGRTYEVVEIKYNTQRNDIRQQIYVGDDRFVYQVDTYLDGIVYTEKYRNFRANQTLPPITWTKEKMPRKPLIATDPVRLGAPAPEFTLPGARGGEYSLNEMLKGKKGMLVCALQGGRLTGGDYHLRQMRVLQEIKDRFGKQGLVVTAVIGGAAITPDVKEELVLNWLPDLKRFSYPVLIDIDVERGIQGSAYPNFNLNGRNNLLLDARGRVVFASENFMDKVNQAALYQALARIGFSVSAGDLENLAK